MFSCYFNMSLWTCMKALSGHIRPVDQFLFTYFMCYLKRMATLNYLQKFANFHEHYKRKEILVFWL